MKKMEGGARALIGRSSMRTTRTVRRRGGGERVDGGARGEYRVGWELWRRRVSNDGGRRGVGAEPGAGVIYQSARDPGRPSSWAEKIMNWAARHRPINLMARTSRSPHAQFGNLTCDTSPCGNSPRDRAVFCFTPLSCSVRNTHVPHVSPIRPRPLPVARPTRRRRTRFLAQSPHRTCTVAHA